MKDQGGSCEAVLMGPTLNLKTTCMYVNVHDILILIHQDISSETFTMIFINVKLDIVRLIIYFEIGFTRKDPDGKMTVVSFFPHGCALDCCSPPYMYL